MKTCHPSTFKRDLLKVEREFWKSDKTRWNFFSLYRIPDGKYKSELVRRTAWLRGLTLHRPDLPIASNTWVCILIFKRQFVQEHPVPNITLISRSPCPTHVGQLSQYCANGLNQMMIKKHVTRQKRHQNRLLIC